MSDLHQNLSHQFPDLKFTADYSLADHTYFKLGGPAEVFVEITERDQIVDVIKYCQQQKIKLTIFGGASNTIVSDKGISGLVLKLSNDKFELDSDQTGHVTAGAGLKTSLLVRHSVDAGLTGLEEFLGVPGNLGGAVFNNAHYLKNLIGDQIHRVEVINDQGQVAWISHDDCQFGYDSSRFQTSHEIILRVEFKLAAGEKEKSMALIKEATQYRASTQPLGEPSSGCIFKNVPVTPELTTRFPDYQDKDLIGGGFLIDQAGLKGTRVGPIVVSDKHAAFLINEGGGTSEQLSQLISIIKKTVQEKFGVELQEEVFYLGDFS
jgi:UDP-N-acetylmuramate dehydrogenase